MAMTPEGLRKKAVADITQLLETFAASSDPRQQKRASLLSYWLSDYARFLRAEDSFDSRKLIKYKRGQIVKVHLGYRIGSEEGGLHYAIVMDNNNSLSSNVVTIVPLTSVKKTSDLDNIPPYNVYLGNEIYRTVFAKLKTLDRSFSQNLEKITNELEETARQLAEKKLSLDELSQIEEKQREQEAELKKLEAQDVRLKKVIKELQRMKVGSIALVGQITTVSKQRIYDPLYPADALHSIRVSNSILDRIDETVINLFTNHK